MNHAEPEPLPFDDTLTAHLALTFLDYYRQIEQTLLRAGYARAARTPWGPRADWEGFARHVAGQFDPDTDPALIGSVIVLLTDPDDPNFRRHRGRVSTLLEPSLPERNTVWLVELIQEIRNQILYGINLRREPACDMTQVMAAMYVLGELVLLDPNVENLLLPIPRPEVKDPKGLLSSI